MAMAIAPIPGVRRSLPGALVGNTGRAMPEEKVEMVLRGIEAFNRRDVDAFAALGTPDAEVVPMRAAVEAISYRGPEGVAQFFADVDEIWDTVSLDLSPAEVDDRTVYASGRLRGRGRASGVDVDMEIAFVFRFRDGLISSSRAYTDVALARKDTGQPK